MRLDSRYAIVFSAVMATLCTLAAIFASARPREVVTDPTNPVLFARVPDAKKRGSPNAPHRALVVVDYADSASIGFYAKIDSVFQLRPGLLQFAVVSFPNDYRFEGASTRALQAECAALENTFFHTLPALLRGDGSKSARADALSSKDSAASCVTGTPAAIGLLRDERIATELGVLSAPRIVLDGRLISRRKSALEIASELDGNP